MLQMRGKVVKRVMGGVITAMLLDEWEIRDGLSGK